IVTPQDKQANRHLIRINKLKGEYGEEQQHAQQPRQMSDELHLITDSKANGGTSSMPPSACRRPRLLFLIDPLAQFLAGFEMRHELLRHVHPLPRFRISADVRRPMIQPEAPAAPATDTLPFHSPL